MIHIYSRTIAITGEAVDNPAKRLDERNKGVIFKNCAPFTDCTSEVNHFPSRLCKK